MSADSEDSQPLIMPLKYNTGETFMGRLATVSDATGRRVGIFLREEDAKAVVALTTSLAEVERERDAWEHAAGDYSDVSQALTEIRAENERLKAQWAEVNDLLAKEPKFDWNNQNGAERQHYFDVTLRHWEQRLASAVRHTALNVGTPKPTDDQIKLQCAHYGGVPCRCLLNERNWAPGSDPKPCALCPDNGGTND